MSPIQYACGTGINQFNGMYVHPHLQQGNYLYTQYPNQKPAISVWQCGRVNSIAVKWMENGSWNLGNMNLGGGRVGCEMVIVCQSGSSSSAAAAG